MYQNYGLLREKVGFFYITKVRVNHTERTY